MPRHLRNCHTPGQAERQRVEVEILLGGRPPQKDRDIPIKIQNSVPIGALSVPELGP
jgi:hypothetical protein